MSWDVFALDLPSGIKSIDEIPEGWSPAPLGKRTDIIAKICALYPEASFDDGLSWSSLRLSGVGIEFNLGEDEEVECLGKHVRGGDPAPQVVARILSWECAQSPPARRADYSTMIRLIAGAGTHHSFRPASIIRAAIAVGWVALHSTRPAERRVMAGLVPAIHSFLCASY